ncbi:hypothetical protein NEUTE1DRAFT_126058 [Neurospora tetrasperma FGSC 2508]|uniref:E3 ubiquitin-protein ligase n=1 Tax=Neurospora tetrasperma (strain FGSC 2508 / ATCC MYA-4615 / P0657) TaxID=510951 RepID=F8N3H3_NEUT8|nr:uncharacterized protein NEUTE1DRAFT_126058 [Neurospora tetrasperma FGSC 2508]EGO52578.1 hypothetical protein NEUTE1DRAFT_126058 [Neurospora tetrasperma FGSC 2508]
MEAQMSTQEQQLCQALLAMPGKYRYRYSEEASRELLLTLFWSMAGGKNEYMKLFFPQGDPRNTSLKLRDAQGAVEGAEYTEAARGKACGHIFKQGEASYACKTCSADDTCCLCSKCFEATDHTGHMVRISISPGNSGCCDCGDLEAWKRPMFCTIHSMWEGDRDKGKGKATELPEDLVRNIRMTIGRVFDYMCDVISCAPEQLRQTKTVQSIQEDERLSRLSSTYCGGETDSPGEYAVLLWNDEKHTVVDVRDQVARACNTTLANGLKAAYETDAIGRSILMYDSSLEKLLEVAEVLERIRVTVTIRSSRDTFREQMCGTIIEWLRDISGCRVGHDHQLLRNIVCEEMLKPWRKGSPAAHAIVGKDGIDDEDRIDQEENVPSGFYEQQGRLLLQARQAARRMAEAREAGEDEGDEDDEDGDDIIVSGGEMDEDEEGDEDVMMLDEQGDAAGDDVAMTDWREVRVVQVAPAAAGGRPLPPPPPPAPTTATAHRRAIREREHTPDDSDTAEPLIAPNIYTKAHLDIPKTPGSPKAKTSPPNPGRYWLQTPAGYVEESSIPVAEDLFERVRLDWLILFDLRMWKKVRCDLRSLYISTVVTIPEFKRVLGLRFAGLYTTLAQLYLIGDREPDHSIINISLQMLTTPSITAEIVERGNFLTSLMAILYTFLTTRQVGHPWDVASNAVLSFDSGSVTNRRMYHFFLDLKYLFGSPHVQERLRTEERYMMQFLDLVKLHQGICPNVRAVGEHVEYETDSWISASLVTREINRLCRQFAQSFRNVKEHGLQYVNNAIRLAAKVTIINSLGAERHRFNQSEIKEEISFRNLTDFEFEPTGRSFKVVHFVVEEQPNSFHHALHYTLSWLIECGKSMSVDDLRKLLTFETCDLLAKPQPMGRKSMPRGNFTPEDYLLVAFDFPLRTALVVCDPSRVLASIVDRYGMEMWIKGFFEQKSKAQDDGQHLDVVEDMLHLLVVLFHEHEDFHKLLDEMTIYKAPEGLTDVGTFELKPEFIEDVDPYIAHYNKNQREESEMAWRKCMAKKTGQSIEDVVYEPNLRPITSGVFAGLSDFTRTGMFAQIIYYSLLYTLSSSKFTPQVPTTRVETFLQVVLHLVLIAIKEDKTGEEDGQQPSFISRSLSHQARSNFMPENPTAKTIVALLNLLTAEDAFKTVHPKIHLILKKMRQQRPHEFESAYHSLGLSVDHIDAGLPDSQNTDEEREKKKKAALARQARVMAQFQAQQKSFMEKQGEIDWGDVDDIDEDEDMPAAEEHKNFWKYPSGTCILCQEDTDDRRLYGSFAFFTESNIYRQTDLQDPDFVREAFKTPENLDRSAESMRPFGLAHENRQIVQKVDQEGKIFEAERSVIGKGFPSHLSRSGPVSTGCGHIMHYGCFEAYFDATLHSAYYVLGAARPPDQIQHSFATYTARTMVHSLAEDSAQLFGDAWVDLGARSRSSGTPFSDSFSIISATEVSSRGATPAEGNSMMRELVSAYRRLRDTLRKNGINSHHDLPETVRDDELACSDALARSVGFSIAAIEIQQRGVEVDYGMTLLEKIPEQVLTHLRILTETVTTFITVGGLREAGDNRIDTEFRRDSERQHCQLFIAQYKDAETDSARQPYREYPPLLSQDPFVFLCECVFGVVPAQRFEIAHIVRLCYLAEITKVVYHMGRNMPATMWMSKIFSDRKDEMSPELANFASFCETVVRMDLGFSERYRVQGSTGENKAFDQPGLDSWEGWYRFIRNYALTFLRKCAILLYARYNIDFNSRVSPNPEQKELERLTETLKLPSFDAMLASLTPDSRISQLVSGWIEHQTCWDAEHSTLAADDNKLLPPSAVLSHPGIFELVGLPKNYATLIEECTRRKCPTKGKDISDPMLCLFCGDLFCGQSICCAVEDREGRGKTMRIGGCQQHMRKCQKNIGLFLNIRRCCIFYLHRLSGSFSNAPYIDKYGEVDLGLRHGRLLYLHQKRYDSMLRNLWLSHGIQSFISRKLEGDINNGGWETL